ncbi:nudix hydrolase 8 isoform X2 [Hermetia illucens]|nr:nudix hydrolase 8 isoform X2 [Hermetia illucens]
MGDPNLIFQGTMDRFKGITIDSCKQKDFTVNFAEKLERSLKYWKEVKNRGVWFKVDTKDVECLPVLTKHGFNFHHAQKGFVTLYKWLPDDEQDNVPDYSHTMVGVGAVVVNDKNEVLVVSDRFAMIPGSWKLPGGYVEAREYLPDAAIREVREETGIISEFQSLLSIRQSHGGGFGCSDIYVVFALKPLSSELHRCEMEIANVAWMPMDEYLKHPHVHETNRKFVHKYLFFKENGIKIDYEKALHQVLKKEYILFNIEKCEW